MSLALKLYATLVASHLSNFIGIPPCGTCAFGSLCSNLTYLEGAVEIRSLCFKLRAASINHFINTCDA
jgi:hypothetical protein